jgi:hypothetical protein
MFGCEESANTHAAIGGPAQRREQQRAGHVVAPDVVLKIERAFGDISQQHAGRECFTTVAQLDDSRLPRMLARAWGD